MTPSIHDPVLFRRHPAEHYQKGRVIGRTFGRTAFDVESYDGERFDNLSDVKLDEREMAKIRHVELAAIKGDAA